MPKACKSKAQPWKTQWPPIGNDDQPATAPSHGFVKGKKLVMDGGNSSMGPTPTTMLDVATKSAQEVLNGAVKVTLQPMSSGQHLKASVGSTPTYMPAVASGSVREALNGAAQLTLQPMSSEQHTLETDEQMWWIKYGMIVGVAVCTLTLVLISWYRVKKFMA